MCTYLYNTYIFSAALNIVPLFMPELLFKLCEVETPTHSMRHYTKKRNVVLFPNRLQSTNNTGLISGASNILKLKTGRRYLQIL